MSILEHDTNAVNGLSETAPQKFGITPAFENKVSEVTFSAGTGNELTGRALMDEWKAKSDEYAMHDGIGLAAMMLVEMADHCEEEPEKRIDFPTPQNLVATLLGFNAIKLAMKCIENAMPTPEEIVADVYWAALETLNAAGLDFGALVAYHDGKNGEVEA